MSISCFNPMFALRALNHKKTFIHHLFLCKSKHGWDIFAQNKNKNT